MTGSFKGRLTVAMLIIAVGLAVAAWIFAARRSLESFNGDGSPAGSSYVENGDAGREGDELYPIFVNRPEGPPRVATGLTDELGRSIDVSCASCHANLEPNFRMHSADDLEDFHTELTFDHGSLSCLTCHNANNYNTLRLADGRSIEYQDVQTMCAQCHGREAREFDRGAHGGMVGYWDRTRGPQVRKNCIDCHDPHAPAFPRMIPTFKPQDRFLEPPRKRD